MSVARIEEKRALLGWLKSKKSTDDIGFENYMCLSSELQRAGWRQTDVPKLWRKGDSTLPMIDAAIKEFSEQVEADRLAHLRKTVGGLAER